MLKCDKIVESAENVTDPVQFEANNLKVLKTSKKNEENQTEVQLSRREPPGSEFSSWNQKLQQLLHRVDHHHHYSSHHHRGSAPFTPAVVPASFKIKASDQHRDDRFQHSFILRFISSNDRPLQDLAMIWWQLLTPTLPVPSELFYFIQLPQL